MNAFAYGVFDVHGEFSQVSVNSNTINSWISWLDSSKKQIKFKYGISYISLEQAKTNLENEIPDWDFEYVKNHKFLIDLFLR